MQHSFILIINIIRPYSRALHYYPRCAPYVEIYAVHISEYFNILYI